MSSSTLTNYLRRQLNLHIWALSLSIDTIHARISVLLNTLATMYPAHHRYGSMTGYWLALISHTKVSAKTLYLGGLKALFVKQELMWLCSQLILQEPLLPRLQWKLCKGDLLTRFFEQEIGRVPKLLRVTTTNQLTPTWTFVTLFLTRLWAI